MSTPTTTHPPTEGPTHDAVTTLPPPVRTRASRPRARAGTALTLTGILLLLVSGVVGAVFAFGLGHHGAEVLDGSATSSSGQVTVDVPAGARRIVFASSAAGTAEGSGCTVRGPGDTPVALRRVVDVSSSSGDGTRDVVLRFTAERSGAHTVRCPGHVVVTDSLFADRAVTGALGVLGSLALGVLGLVVLLLGVVVWIVQVSHRPAAN